MPPDSGDSGSALVAAARWIEAIATGQIATALAIIAVAAFGVAMLAGRIDWRRGAAVIIGCFLIFGARNLTSAFQAPRERVQSAKIAAESPLASPSPPDVPFDPYAGASPSR